MPGTKIALLYLKTGGGHLAPARALARYYEQRVAPEVTPVLIDGLEHGPAFARFIIEDGYRILQSRARWYYEVLYALNKFRPLAYFNALMTSAAVYRSLREALEHERPDRIVILHFFLIRPTLVALKSLGMHVPVTVLVTDLFTAHPLWFLNREPEFIVCSEILRRHCIALGIPDAQIHVFPPITDVRFSERIPDDRIPIVKAGLGLPADRPVVLMLGGADGLPRGARILRRIVESNPPVHIAIVCGKNGRLEEKARAIAAVSPVPVTVFGYTDRVYELINVSDVVITKGGASTMMEILLSGKMPVVSDYLWEQEKGNVEYLIEHGVGMYEHHAKEIPRTLNRYFSDRDWREEVARKIGNLRLQNGVPMIAECIHRQQQGA